MENETPAAGTPVDAPAASAPAATNPPPAAPPATPPASPDTFSRQYVEELRQEAANYRTRSTSAETQLTQAQAATELAQTVLLKAIVISKATELKIVDADAALALIGSKF